MKRQAPPLAYPLAMQRDLVVDHGENCPTCGQRWRGAVRVCRLCGQVVGRRHKWRLVPAGPGLFAIQHIDCNAPEAPRAKVHEQAEGGSGEA